MAATNFSGPVVSKSTFNAEPFTVATAPDAAEAGAGAIAYISNGAAGSPIVAFSDGTDWLRSDTGAVISATV